MKRVCPIPRLHLPVLFLVWLVIITFSGCKPGGKISGKYVPGQLIVLYDTSADEETRRAIRQRVENNNYKFQTIKCDCDGSIEIWAGEGIEALLTDTSTIKGEAKPISRSGVSGDDSIFISRNLLIPLPTDSEASMTRMPVVASKDQHKVKIAVLDTGLDTAFFQQEAYDHFLMRPSEIEVFCTPGARDTRYVGWNFINHSVNFQDDHPGKHGTNVTGLALGEGITNWLQILPLKTHDNTGNGVLFNLLCAMKYAKKAKVDYINASWGDYGSENIVFTRVLKELEVNNIVFITAAGNDANDLANHPFFPACYSSTVPGSLTNVISVTTVKATGSCPHNNFSSNFVDIGVTGTNDPCLFRSVFQTGNTFQIRGSSFATAVMTGIIANHAPYTGPGTLKNRVLESGSLIPVLTMVPDVRTHKGFKQH